MSRATRRRAVAKRRQQVEPVDYASMNYHELKRAVKAAGLEPVSWSKANMLAVMNVEGWED